MKQIVVTLVSQITFDLSASEPKEASGEVVIHEGEMSLDDSDRTVKYLFTTKTCPNCAKAEQMLSGEEYVIIDAEDEPELTQKFGVMQAPTLVITHGDETEKYVNASNIQKYVDAL